MPNVTGPTLREQRQQLGLSQAKLASLTGIPQHLLSAFELGKAELPSTYLSALSATLLVPDQLRALARRPKRYQEHSFGAVPHDPDRVKSARQTLGNLPFRQMLDELWAGHSASGPRDLSALSLFAGCGGFSLGFSAAGFALKGFVEIDDALAAIYRANFPHSQQFGSDVSGFDQARLAVLADSLPNLDLIIGGPPCQGFSLAGKRQVDDPRNSLFRHYMAFVDALKPRMAIIENVRLLTSMKTPSGSLVSTEIRDDFARHGYRVRCFEINAKDYGVPQHRERVLFVAARHNLGVEPSVPFPTHGPESGLFSTTAPHQTFGDACSDLEYLEAGDTSRDPLHIAVAHPKHVIEWLWDVPEGSSAHDNNDPTKRPPSGYNTTYKRQVWREPGSTVQTTFGMISGCRNVHPIATRSLTVREAARVQSFPDQFRFEGTLGDIRRGIGNAVPPLLASVVANHIAAQLRVDRSIPPQG